MSRKIALFEGGRFYPHKVPLEITLLFDCSGSMDAADILNTKVFEKNLLEEYENVSVAIYDSARNWCGSPSPPGTEGCWRKR